MLRGVPVYQPVVFWVGVRGNVRGPVGGWKYGVVLLSGEDGAMACEKCEARLAAMCEERAESAEWTCPQCGEERTHQGDYDAGCTLAFIAACVCWALVMIFGPGK